jgi:hypothetical protein
MHELGMYVCSLLARMLNNCCDMKRAGLKHSWKCSKISAEKNIFFFSHTKSFEWIFMMGQNSAFPGAIFQLCLVASTKIYGSGTALPTYIQKLGNLIFSYKIWYWGSLQVLKWFNTLSQKLSVSTCNYLTIYLCLYFDNSFCDFVFIDTLLPTLFATG